MENLFVYGSLLFNEIIEGLTGKTFQSERAILSGFKRVSLIDADYPALVKDKNATAEGRVLFNLDRRSLDIISFFEGDEYAQTIVDLNQSTLKALTFTWKANLNYTKDIEWDARIFETESLPFYMKEIIPETVEAFNKMDSQLF